MIRQSQGFLTQLYALVDFACIQLVFLLTWWMKFESGWLSGIGPLPIKHYFLWSVIYGVLAVGGGYFLNLYKPKRKKSFSFELLKLVQIHVVSVLLLVSILYLFKEVDVSRSYLFLFVLNNLIAASIYRFCLKYALRRYREKGYNKQFVLILGAGSLGRSFYQSLLQHKELGFEALGFLDDYQTEHEPAYRHYKPILGKVDDLAGLLETLLIDEVIIALPLDAHRKFASIVAVCEKAGVRTMIIPDFYDILPSRPYFDNFAGIPLINVRDIPLDEFRNRFLKRAFDIAFSFVAIIATSPLLLIIAAAVKLTSRGPVIYKQERVGLNRRPFMMYKFRSMRVDAGNGDTGWTTKGDPRRTVVGVWLRKTSLDELPQFFNVLLGHMSVVGPRPERQHFVEQFKEEVPKYMVKHHIRPGITGWAQANGLRGDTSIEERISHDIFYIENWSLLFDLKIIGRTLVMGFVNKNAY